MPPEIEGFETDNRHLDLGRTEDAPSFETDQSSSSFQTDHVEPSMFEVDTPEEDKPWVYPEDGMLRRKPEPPPKFPYQINTDFTPFGTAKGFMKHLFAKFSLGMFQSGMQWGASLLDIITDPDIEVPATAFDQRILPENLPKIQELKQQLSALEQRKGVGSLTSGRSSILTQRQLEDYNSNLDSQISTLQDQIAKLAQPVAIGAPIKPSDPLGIRPLIVPEEQPQWAKERIEWMNQKAKEFQEVQLEMTGVTPKDAPWWYKAGETSGSGLASLGHALVFGGGARAAGLSRSMAINVGAIAMAAQEAAPIYDEAIEGYMRQGDSKGLAKGKAFAEQVKALGVNAWMERIGLGIMLTRKAGRPIWNTFRKLLAEPSQEVFQEAGLIGQEMSGWMKDRYFSDDPVIRAEQWETVWPRLRESFIGSILPGLIGTGAVDMRTQIADYTARKLRQTNPELTADQVETISTKHANVVMNNLVRLFDLRRAKARGLAELRIRDMTDAKLETVVNEACGKKKRTREQMQKDFMDWWDRQAAGKELKEFKRLARRPRLRRRAMAAIFHDPSLHAVDLIRPNQLYVVHEAYLPRERMGEVVRVVDILNINHVRIEFADGSRTTINFRSLRPVADALDADLSASVEAQMLIMEKAKEAEKKKEEHKKKAAIIHSLEWYAEEGLKDFQRHKPLGGPKSAKARAAMIEKEHGRAKADAYLEAFRKEQLKADAKRVQQEMMKEDVTGSHLRKALFIKGFQETFRSLTPEEIAALDKLEPGLVEGSLGEPLVLQVGDKQVKVARMRTKGPRNNRWIYYTGEAPGPVNRADQLMTPPEVAKEMAEALFEGREDSRGGLVVDPTVGDGALLEAAEEIGAEQTAGIDLSARMVAEAHAKGHRVVQGQGGVGLIRAFNILLNPPFAGTEGGIGLKMLQDVFEFDLLPGGRMVALLPASAFGKDKQLRPWLEAQGAIIGKSRHGEFRVPGTDQTKRVGFRVVVINKPGPAELENRVEADETQAPQVQEEGAYEKVGRTPPKKSAVTEQTQSLYKRGLIKSFESQPSAPRDINKPFSESLESEIQKEIDFYLEVESEGEGDVLTRLEAIRLIQSRLGWMEYRRFKDELGDLVLPPPVEKAPEAKGPGESFTPRAEIVDHPISTAEDVLRAVPRDVFLEKVFTLVNQLTELSEDGWKEWLTANFPEFNVLSENNPQEFDSLATQLLGDAAMIRENGIKHHEANETLRREAFIKEYMERAEETLKRQGKFNTPDGQKQLDKTRKAIIHLAFLNHPMANPEMGITAALEVIENSKSVREQTLETVEQLIKDNPDITVREIRGRITDPQGKKMLTDILKELRGREDIEVTTKDRARHYKFRDKTQAADTATGKPTAQDLNELQARVDTLTYNVSALESEYRTIENDRNMGFDRQQEALEELNIQLMDAKQELADATRQLTEAQRVTRKEVTATKPSNRSRAQRDSHGNYVLWFDDIKYRIQLAGDNGRVTDVILTGRELWDMYLEPSLDPSDFVGTPEPILDKDEEVVLYNQTHDAWAKMNQRERVMLQWVAEQMAAHTTFSMLADPAVFIEMFPVFADMEQDPRNTVYSFPALDGPLLSKTWGDLKGVFSTSRTYTKHVVETLGRWFNRFGSLEDLDIAKKTNVVGLLVGVGQAHRISVEEVTIAMKAFHQKGGMLEGLSPELAARITRLLSFRAESAEPGSMTTLEQHFFDIFDAWFKDDMRLASFLGTREWPTSEISRLSVERDQLRDELGWSQNEDGVWIEPDPGKLNMRKRDFHKKTQELEELDTKIEALGRYGYFPAMVIAASFHKNYTQAKMRKRNIRSDFKRFMKHKDHYTLDDWVAFCKENGYQAELNIEILAAYHRIGVLTAARQHYFWEELKRVPSVCRMKQLTPNAHIYELHRQIDKATAEMADAKTDIEKARLKQFIKARQQELTQMKIDGEGDVWHEMPGIWELNGYKNDERKTYYVHPYFKAAYDQMNAPSILEHPGLSKAGQKGLQGLRGTLLFAKRMRFFLPHIMAYNNFIQSFYYGGPARMIGRGRHKEMIWMPNTYTKYMLAARESLVNMDTTYRIALENGIIYAAPFKLRNYTLQDFYTTLLRKQSEFGQQHPHLARAQQVAEYWMGMSLTEAKDYARHGKPLVPMYEVLSHFTWMLDAQQRIAGLHFLINQGWQLDGEVDYNKKTGAIKLIKDVHVDYARLPRVLSEVASVFFLTPSYTSMNLRNQGLSLFLAKKRWPQLVNYLMFKGLMRALAWTLGYMYINAFKAAKLVPDGDDDEDAFPSRVAYIVEPGSPMGGWERVWARGGDELIKKGNPKRLILQWMYMNSSVPLHIVADMMKTSDYRGIPISEGGSEAEIWFDNFLYVLGEWIATPNWANRTFGGQDRELLDTALAIGAITRYSAPTKFVYSNWQKSAARREVMSYLMQIHKGKINPDPMTRQRNIKRILDGYKEEAEERKAEFERLKKRAREYYRATHHQSVWPSWVYEDYEGEEE